MTQPYDAHMIDPRGSIGGLIGCTRSALFSIMHEALKPYDLNMPQYIAIIMIASGAAQRPSDICKLINHDPGAMTRAMDQLEKRKLVKRVPDANDRRAIKVELTPQGRALVPKLMEIKTHVANDFLQGFSKTEVNQLETFLRRILGNAAKLDKDLHIHIPLNT